VLGGGVRRHKRRCAQADDRGDRDDAAKAALDHAPKHGLRGMHHADHVLFEHVAELLGLRLGKRRARRGAGIGDENVDRAARRDRLPHATIHGFRVGDVGDHVARRLALPHHLAERLFAAARDGDGGAGLRQG
jgi:hypothetical protein